MATLVRALQRMKLTPTISAAISSNTIINKPLLPSINPFYVSAKTTASFFNKLPAERLWDSVTSVSNAGAKKGRGKGAGRKRIVNLNRGQIIGVGKANIVWPGLNSPIIKGNELVKQQKLPEDKEREEKLHKMRDSVNVFRFLKLHPLERGWSGNKWPGRKLGPPDPVGDYTYEGFQSICLHFKALLSMKGPLGRYRRIGTMVVTGNGNGLVGFGIGKSKEGTASLRKARNRAGQKLMYIEICDGHTVFHDIFTQFSNTRIFIKKKPEGYGLICHRAIKAICEVIGIKDLHAKIEGPTTIQHIVKAFLIGLLNQKTHRELAEKKKLHLVELCKENHFFPRVLASPSTVRKAEEIPQTEILDFTQSCLDDRVILKRPKYPPFYTRLPSWKTNLRRLEARRNHEKIKMDYLVERGELKSFLNDKYPNVEEKEEES